MRLQGIFKCLEFETALAVVCVVHDPTCLQRSALRPYHLGRVNRGAGIDMPCPFVRRLTIQP